MSHVSSKQTDLLEQVHDIFRATEPNHKKRNRLIKQAIRQSDYLKQLLEESEVPIAQRELLSLAEELCERYTKARQLQRQFDAFEDNARHMGFSRIPPNIYADIKFVRNPALLPEAEWLDRAESVMRSATERLFADGLIHLQNGGSAEVFENTSVQHIPRDEEVRLYRMLRGELRAAGVQMKGADLKRLHDECEAFIKRYEHVIGTPGGITVGKNGAADLNGQHATLYEQRERWRDWSSVQKASDPEAIVLLKLQSCVIIKQKLGKPGPISSIARIVSNYPFKLV